MATAPLPPAEIDGDLYAFLIKTAMTRCFREYGGSFTELRMPVELVRGPDPMYAVVEDRTFIFLTPDATWHQLRYQLAHEVFHWICTPDKTFHWVHEMLAVETAVQCMNDIGELDYAFTSAAGLSSRAGDLKLTDMLTQPLTFEDSHYAYADVYGRAYAVCQQLKQRVGWPAVARLSRAFDDQGRPDVAGWIRSLPVDDQVKVDAYFGVPRSALV
jgi:hypothetical protein